MVLLQTLKESFEEQQLLLNKKLSSITRSHYKATSKKNTHIEVISGIRRCGKSTLLQQLIFKQKGKIAYFNFEDTRVFNFEIDDFKKLNQIINKDTVCYFFDEIQNIKNWEIYIRSLHDAGKKVYITGSNASLLSKELGTRLTGRYIAHELFPFSFNEFLDFRKRKATTKNAIEYLKTGGFPEYLQIESPEILQQLLKDIVYRDIAIRYGIRNTQSLMELTLFLLSNIGKEHSYHSVKRALNINSPATVSDYMNWLADCYILFYLPRFSWSAKSRQKNPRKVYAIDNGFVRCNSLSFSEDSGRLLENAVFMHLRKSPFQLYYFREEKECDFVVLEKNRCKAVIQVTVQIDADNQKRELSGLMEAMDFFEMKEGYIITKNQKDKIVLNGKTVFLIPVLDFFVSEIF